MLEKESQNHEFLVIVDELLDSINSGDIIANKVGMTHRFIATKLFSAYMLIGSLLRMYCWETGELGSFILEALRRIAKPETRKFLLKLESNCWTALLIEFQSSFQTLLTFQSGRNLSQVFNNQFPT